MRKILAFLMILAAMLLVVPQSFASSANARLSTARLAKNYSSPIMMQVPGIGAVNLSQSTDASNYYKYTYLITDASQFSSNNSDQSEGADFNTLIDGNKDTFWSSNWHAGETDNGVHYLQISFSSALPDSVALNYTVRQSDDYCNCPTDFMVTGSVDGTTWTNLKHFTSDADGCPTGNTITPYSAIINNTTGYKYLRITVNGTSGGKFVISGHPYFALAEIEIAEAVYTAKQPLDQYMETFNMSDYVYSKNPGCIGDSLAYVAFFNAYSDAEQLISTGSATDDQLDAACETLKAAKAAAEATRAEPQSDKYYYVRSNYDVFTSGIMEWYAPRVTDKTHMGWRKAQVSKNDAWIFVKQSDGNYSIQNWGSGTFVNHNETVDTDDSPLVTSETFETGQTLTSFDYKGNFTIRSSSATRFYNTQGHNSGASSEGPIANWTSGVTGECSWRITEVPAADLAVMNSRINYNKLLEDYTAYNSYIGTTKIGDNPGECPQALYDAVSAELAASKNLLDNSGSYGESDFLTEDQALLNAVNTAVASITNIPDGYYRVQSAYQDVYRAGIDYGWRINSDSTACWNRVDKNSLDYVWKITKLADGNYSIQSAKNGKYIHKAPKTENYSFVDLSAEARVEQVIGLIRPDGQWYIQNPDQKNFYYDIAGHRNGSGYEGGIELYQSYSSHSGSTWYLKKVTDAEVTAMQATQPQTDLNYKLAQKIREAKQLYVKNTAFTQGAGIVTDAATQLFANNNSPNEGAHIEYLIDGNTDTYWNNTWEDGAETEDAPSYIRVYDAAGLPDSLQFSFIMRNNSSWHRSPSKELVFVSNDATTWTELKQEIDISDMNDFALNLKPRTALVTGCGGYKYIKFMVCASANGAYNGYMNYNDHAVFEMSEFNLYPVTIDKDNSVTFGPSHKIVAADLLAAIKAADSENNGGTATQASIDALTTAIDNFNNAGLVDSLVARARINVNDFTSGENIGDFPETDLTTYDTNVQGILDAIDVAGGALTVAQQNTYRDQLFAAYNTLYAKMVKPVDGKWYFIQSADSASGRTGLAMSAGGGNSNTNDNGQYSYLLSYESMADAANDDWAGFTLTAKGDGTYIMQCVGTAGYNGPESGTPNDGRVYQWYKPTPVTIVPFGNSQVGFRVPATGNFIKATTDWYSYGGLNYTNTSDYKYYQTGYAWNVNAISEVAPTFNNAVSIYQGRAICYTKPYDLDGLPITSYGTLQGYELVGKVETGGLITAYKLHALGATDVIKAGTPVIYIAQGTPYSESVKYDLSFKPVIDGTVTNKADTINGLAGNNDYYLTPVDHLGYCIADSVTDEPAGTGIGYQRGIIIPALVEEKPDASVDAYIYVKGAGMLNNVNVVKVEDANAKVNVYTIDGVLLKKGVARSKATDNLVKGIYIVGKKKVLVK